jgi:sugar phosphate isomerase/epimerase
MIDVQRSLGVQSWCFRQFTTLDGLVGQIKSIGLSRVELCEVHANFGDEGSFERLISGLHESGVAITSIGVQRFKGDEPTEEKWFRFCKMAGARMISATFDVAAVPQAFRIAEKLAEKYDMVVGIHNHGGYDWLGNAMMLKHAFNSTGERIGLCIDSGWCMQAGEEPLKWVEKFQGRLFGTHIKDFVFHRDGRPEDVVAGTGNLKLAEYLAAIAQAPRVETVTLEYEGDAENPGPKLKECVERVNRS